MVVIRLARGGYKKNPFYKLVVADKRAPRDGRYIEQLGYFNPMARGQEQRLQLSLERLEHWLGQGAVPSDRVSTLVKAAKKGQGLKATLPSKAERAEQARQALKQKPTKKVEATSEESVAQAPEQENQAEKNADNAKADAKETPATDTATRENVTTDKADQSTDKQSGDDK